MNGRFIRDSEGNAVRVDTPTNDRQTSERQPTSHIVDTGAGYRAQVERNRLAIRSREFGARTRRAEDINRRLYEEETSQRNSKMAKLAAALIVVGILSYGIVSGWHTDIYGMVGDLFARNDVGSYSAITARSSEVPVVHEVMPTYLNLTEETPPIPIVMRTSIKDLLFDSGVTHNAHNHLAPTVGVENSVVMAGNAFQDVTVYRSGPGTQNFRRRYPQNAFTLHNLGGQFTQLSGHVGRVDGSGQLSATLRIYGDGNLLRTDNLNATAIPIPIELSVVGVNLLRIEVEFPSAPNNHADPPAIYAFFGIFDYTPAPHFTPTPEQVPPIVARTSINGLLFDSGVTHNAYNHLAPTVGVENSVIMAGNIFQDVTVYRSGPGTQNFRRRYPQNAFTLHNLSGQFTRLTGYIGRVDGSGQLNAVLRIYGDGSTLKALSLNATEMPHHIDLSVDGIRLLRIEVEFPSAPSNHTDPPAIFAFSGIVE